MTGRLRQLLEPRLRQQAGIEKSQTPVERDILVQWVRNTFLLKETRLSINIILKSENKICFKHYYRIRIFHG